MKRCVLTPLAVLLLGLLLGSDSPNGHGRAAGWRPDTRCEECGRTPRA